MNRLHTLLVVTLLVLVSSCKPDAPPPVVPDPTINVSAPENRLGTGVTFGAPELSTATKSLSGPDAALFRATDTTIEFVAAPDFENPRDANKDNIYEVTVTFVGAGLSSTVQYRIAITDASDLPPGLTNLNITTTINSSQLFDFTLASGQSYAVQGSRDVNGRPEAIEAINVRNLQGVDERFLGKSLQVFTNANGRFEDVYFETGEYVKFSFDGNGKVSAISVTSSDGATAGVVTLDGSAPLSQKSVTSAAPPPNIRKGQRIKAVPLAPSSAPGCEVAAKAQAMSAMATTATAPANVSVRECGTPISGARVIVIREEQGLAPTYPAQQVGEGLYRAMVPVGTPGPGAEFAEQCSALIENLGNVCDAFDQAGGPRTAAAMLTSCLFLRAPQLIVACQAAVTAFVGYCEFSTIIGPIGEGICESIGERLDEPSASLQFYTARAYFPSGAQGESATVSAPRTGPIPSMSVEAGDLTGPALTSIIVPPDPGPSQGYEILVSASCRANADNISIQISGTDGYQDATSCPLTNKQGGCRLSVPGGSAGVVDTITIVAGTERRTLVIVF